MNTTSISMDKKYQTQNGTPVKLIAIADRGDFPVIGFIGEKTETISYWTLEGKCNLDYTRLLDLMEVPKEMVYLVIQGVKYERDEVVAVFKDQDAALRFADATDRTHVSSIDEVYEREDVDRYIYVKPMEVIS